MASATDLAASPNPLARHYSRFGVADRLLLSGHSHQAWPDVAREGLVAAYDDAAADVDQKWERAFAQAEAVRAGLRTWLDEPDGQLALGASTHDLLLRFLSAVDLPARPRLVTTDGEFHALRRQLDRLGEEGVTVVRVPVEPLDTLTARMADELRTPTAAALVSSVLFETSRIVPHLDHLATACAAAGSELLVDAYHQLGVMPLPIERTGLADAWVVGGGYKYLQLGEGNCFLRLPAHAADLRPVVTGWFAEFGDLAEDTTPDRVAYAAGADRFAGATYDPSSHYRGARVLRFFADQGLTPTLLEASYARQRSVLARAFDALDAPPQLITRDRATPDAAHAGFLALTSPHAADLASGLSARGVRVDSRGDHLRFGPAPYLSDAQLETAIGVLGAVVAEIP
ncbi:kynureninase [Nocardioides panacisoli]|uniref:kynureninase n=1 Tax=Nocardioides panacisoli TaxID=627624 RepID=UPI001C6301CF|nr:kynureninase [Nocardioides panacisoli]QYJ04603.1 kynureninase [Nocardioides panacisoli]